MNKIHEKPAVIPPHIYDKDYYLTDNEGCHEYQSLNDTIHDKFKRALELADIKAGENVLDIGCGRGELLYYAIKKGANHALGIDYSQAAIELAQETIKRLPLESQSKAEAKVANIETLNFQKKYDVIFMIEIAEHMHDWQLEDTFSVIQNILSEKGRLIIMTPNYYYENILQPTKTFLSLPGRLLKYPLRVIRGKYKPKNLSELICKIFRFKVDRGERNRRMHCNITTPARMKNHLKNFNIHIWCEDHSLNPISLLTEKWWGREIMVIARKKN